MKHQTLYTFCSIIVLFIIFPLMNVYAQNVDNFSYIKAQREIYGYIIEKLNAGIYSDSKRDPDFDICPMQELNNDFLGFHFELIHNEQAGFLDCDGPTFLNIYRSGLYINNTGNIEY